jgi:epidermal growth factor receptor substrate 15
MHLVYKALESRAIPSTLPKELLKPVKTDNNDFGAECFANFPTDIVPVAPVIPPSRPVVPAMQPIPAIPSAVGKGDWVLSTVEKLKFQELFESSDKDKDGLVSGPEIKDVFLKSGLPQNMLAHIWSLCDSHQVGKLNNEQFALACWLIERKKKGIDPPLALAPEMIPPSMRPNAAPPQPPKPIFTNPELEMISKEIEELTKERHAIEAEVNQKEADIRIKTGEMRSLQSELDTLTATLKQLETQRGEAQKRLDDLKTQVSTNFSFYCHFYQFGMLHFYYDLKNVFGTEEKSSRQVGKFSE